MTKFVEKYLLILLLLFLICNSFAADYSDNFERANESPLTYPPWGYYSSRYNLTDSIAVASVSWCKALYSYVFADNQYSYVIIPTIGSYNGPLVRGTHITSNGYFLVIYAASSGQYRFMEGTNSVVATVTPYICPRPNDTLKLLVHTDSLFGFLNATFLGSAQDLSYGSGDAGFSVTNVVPRSISEWMGGDIPDSVDIDTSYTSGGVLTIAPTGTRFEWKDSITMIATPGASRYTKVYGDTLMCGDTIPTIMFFNKDFQIQFNTLQTFQDDFNRANEDSLQLPWRRPTSLTSGNIALVDSAAVYQQSVTMYYDSLCLKDQESWAVCSLLTDLLSGPATRINSNNGANFYFARAITSNTYGIYKGESILISGTLTGPIMQDGDTLKLHSAEADTHYLYLNDSLLGQAYDATYTFGYTGIRIGTSGTTIYEWFGGDYPLFSTPAPVIDSIVENPERAGNVVCFYGNNFGSSQGSGEAGLQGYPFGTAYSWTDTIVCDTIPLTVPIGSYLGFLVNDNGDTAWSIEGVFDVLKYVEDVQCDTLIY